MLLPENKCKATSSRNLGRVEHNGSRGIRRKSGRKAGAKSCVAWQDMRSLDFTECNNVSLGYVCRYKMLSLPV